jgi:hypothetical protein
MTCGVVVVELRGFEPLTPCMPSRDPRHDVHHEPSRSRPSQRSRRAGAWWFAWVRRAELLRICCAKWRERCVQRGELLARRPLAERLGPLLGGRCRDGLDQAEAAIMGQPGGWVLTADTEDL